MGGLSGVGVFWGGVEGVICAAMPSSQATRNTGKSIANKNIANPTAALLAACMMLDHLRWAGLKEGGGAGNGGAGLKGVRLSRGWGQEEGERGGAKRGRG